MRAVAGLLLFAAGAAAQTPRQREIAGEIYEKAAAKETGPDLAGVLRRDALTGASEIDGLIAAWLLDERRGTEALFRWLDSRTGVETGAPPPSSGAGSLVMKGLAPMILSMAIENGGVSSERAGTVVTFRSTPRGLARAIAGVVPSTSAPAFLDRFSGAASFDMSPGNEPGALTARAGELLGWSARFEAVNRRDSNSRAFANDWDRLSVSGAGYRDAAEQIAGEFSRWPELIRWQAELAQRVERDVERPYRGQLMDLASARTEYLAILGVEFAKLRRLPVPDSIERGLSRYARELAALLEGRAAIRSRAARGTLLTFDFTSGASTRSARGYWIVTAVLETLAGRGRRDDVLINTGLDSLHRFHAGIAYEAPRRPARLILAARSSTEPGFGRMADAQAGLTIVIPSTGFRIPISVTTTHYGILRKTTLGARIGLHYNADLMFFREWVK
jgi:hypothetical protein